MGKELLLWIVHAGFHFGVRAPLNAMDLVGDYGLVTGDDNGCIKVLVAGSLLRVFPFTNHNALSSGIFAQPK